MHNFVEITREENVAAFFFAYDILVAGGSQAAGHASVLQIEPKNYELVSGQRHKLVNLRYPPAGSHMQFPSVFSFGMPPMIFALTHTRAADVRFTSTV